MDLTNNGQRNQLGMQSPSATVALLSGAAGSAISTLAFYPIELIKVRRAAAIGRQAGAFCVASRLVREGALYQGCAASLFKNVLTDALYFAWQVGLTPHCRL